MKCPFLRPLRAGDAARVYRTGRPVPLVAEAWAAAVINAFAAGLAFRAHAYTLVIVIAVFTALCGVVIAVGHRARRRTAAAGHRLQSPQLEGPDQP